MSNTEHSQRPHFSEWKLPTLICSRLLNASKRRGICTEQHVHLTWRGAATGTQHWAALLAGCARHQLGQKSRAAAAASLNDALLMLACGCTQHSSAAVEG